ncbi:unnamed protein product [Closterium sp. NIES-54]
MEVARTSMCHVGAPQFLWPKAARYAAHQLNMWPSDAQPWVTPISLWTGAAAKGGCTGAAGLGDTVSGGAGGVRVETFTVEDRAVSIQWPSLASPPGFPSVPQFPPRSSLRPVAVEPRGVFAGGTGDTGGVVAGGSCSGGAGAGDTGTATPTPRTVRFLTHVQRLDWLEKEERDRFERAQQQQQEESQSER